MIASTSTATSFVEVHTEWDPLKEVVIGRIEGARIPMADRGLHAIELYGYAVAEEIPSGPIDDLVAKDTAEELEALCDELRALDIVVRRPEPTGHESIIATPDWQSDGLYDYCPRDVLLTIGKAVIEAPMVLRARFLESFSYKRLLLEYFDSGAHWISAPKPRLADEMYDPEAPLGKRLQDSEPAFDAANVLRLGTDVLYLVSDSGNEKGLRWLQSTLGGNYTVHPCRGLYASTHVDSTIVPLRPGLVLLNPERVNDANMPEVLRSWDKIWCPELVDTGFVGEHARASRWIGMNLLMLRPDLAVIDDRQPQLIRQLEAHGINVLPHRLTHARTLGGGFHCVSLDIRRTGKLETYR